MSINRFIPAIAWFILLLILLCLPGSTIPKYPWLATIHFDKWVHISLFFILCFLFCRPFRNSNQTNEQRKKWFVWILLSGILYGTIMEFVQKYWIPNRSFEVWDIAADSVGCLLAYWYSSRKFLQRG
ncbi:MAG: VanZ family protein [Bacteroidota bacterium]